jgi:RimJ/RimL family protein N-acetyltransferase
LGGAPAGRPPGETGHSGEGHSVALLDSVTTISGRLVSMRPISREDYPTLFGWRSSFSVSSPLARNGRGAGGEGVHWLNFRRRIGPFEEFVRELEGMLQSGAILLLVRRAKTGDAIGYAMAHSLNHWDGWLAVGLYVEPRFRTRGHGGEAALLCVDSLFRTFPLRKIITELYEFADSVLVTTQAMGFEQTGFIADHYWHDDRYWGVHHLELTRESWLRRRERFIDILQLQMAHREVAFV